MCPLSNQRVLKTGIIPEDISKKIQLLYSPGETEQMTAKYEGSWKETVFSASCNCGSAKDTSTAAPENLHARITGTSTIEQQLGKLCGLLNSLDHEDLHLRNERDVDGQR